MSLSNLLLRGPLARFFGSNAAPPPTKKGGVAVARPLPQPEAVDHLYEAYRLQLSSSTGALVVSDSRAVDIVTRIQLVR